MGEGRLRAGLARGFQQIERAGGIGVEIIERDRRRPVVRRLRGGVDDGVVVVVVAVLVVGWE